MYYKKKMYNDDDSQELEEFYFGAFIDSFLTCMMLYNFLEHHIVFVYNSIHFSHKILNSSIS